MMRYPIPPLAATLALFLTLVGCGEQAPPVKISVRVSSDLAESSTDGGTGKVAGYGTLTGTITFSGKAPTLAAVRARGMAERDSTVCAKDEAIQNDSFVIGDGGGLDNVFVYLAKKPRGTKSPESFEPIDFDQKNCRFTNHASIVHVGQDVMVKNSDGVSHNTHTYPKRNNGDNFAVAPNNSTGIAVSFIVSENKPFRIGCDIHGWMQAWQLALDHPYGRVTTDGGKFTIESVPAGQHSVVIWHELAEILETVDVTIEVDGTTSLDKAYDASKFKLP